MLVSLIIVIPSAYVFGRLDFKGKSTMFYLVLLIIMFPFVLLIIPIAESWFTLGLYNTVPGMWIAYQIFVAPFAIWVLRDYFAKLPSTWRSRRASTAARSSARSVVSSCR